MPQLRQNLILKEWVIISTERAKRPEQLKEEKNVQEEIPEYDETCPFCPGNEEKTGNTKEFYRIEDAGKWKLRVIPNKFPALVDPESEINVFTEGNFRWMDGVGHHEVIVECPDHHLTLGTMEEEKVERIIHTYRKRYEDLMALSHIESIILFRNHGARAGASLIHPHSQLIALPIIPRDLMVRMNESIRYHEEHRMCIFCRLLHAEMESGERTVFETPHFYAFVPYAAYSPFQMWIFPKRHDSSFIHITDEETKDLSVMLRTALRKLYIGLNNPAYNCIFRSAPKGYENSQFFHWYVTIVPRLTRTAGFELGSGMFINPSVPEENAAYLRNTNTHTEC